MSLADGTEQALRGQVAIVTGAGGGGCGGAIAVALAKQGAAVVANGLEHHRDALEALDRDEPALTILPWIADVTRAEQVHRMVEAAESELGAPTIAVHNAAPSLPPVAIDALRPDHWRAELDVILDGAYNLASATVPCLRKRGGGRLIFISSNAAHRGARGRSASYSAAKAGLHGLAMHLALELGPANITCNVVVPSQVDTRRARRDGRRTESSMRRSAALVPLGRVGRPSDVAGVVAFLASAAAEYINGQLICVDGGSSLASPMTALPRRSP
jgi:NAD(P)-dependent dehydrogenase (short-subunit alcohol dehydrogenase family)